MHRDIDLSQATKQHAAKSFRQRSFLLIGIGAFVLLSGLVALLFCGDLLLSRVENFTHSQNEPTERTQLAHQTGDLKGKIDSLRAIQSSQRTILSFNADTLTALASRHQIRIVRVTRSLFLKNQLQAPGVTYLFQGEFFNLVEFLHQLESSYVIDPFEVALGSSQATRFELLLQLSLVDQQ